MTATSITQLSDGRLVVTYMTYVPGRKPMTHGCSGVVCRWREDVGPATAGRPPLKGNEAVSDTREMPTARFYCLYGAAERVRSPPCACSCHDGGEPPGTRWSIWRRAPANHRSCVCRMAGS